MSTPLTDYDSDISYDGELDVQVSNDLLSASLFYFPIDENRERSFEKEALLQFIKDRGVSYGIKEEVIDQFIAAPARYIKQELIIAEGIPPINGEDSYLELLCYSSDQRKPKVKADGSVDFYSITDIANVAKGQILAKKIPSTEGVKGISVAGEPIPAKNGVDKPLKAGKNVVIDQDNQAIYAAIDGQVSVTNVINVFPVFEVNGDLDLSIGNIDFVGNVVIRGNVPNGFKVSAKGDIRITGGVEAAEIISEGSIHIQSGITAQHKGLVKAGMDVQAGFIVNGIVQAERNVRVTQSIMHSHVMAGERVECLGDKGLIVGGHIQSGAEVICNIVGNSMTASTTIEVGSQPRALNRRREIERESIEIKETLEKTDKAMKVLAQLAQKLGQLPPDKHALNIRLMKTKLEGERKRQELLEELAELELQIQNEKQAKIQVSGTLYAGTRLILGKYMKYIKETQKHIKYELENNVIVGKTLV